MGVVLLERFSENERGRGSRTVACVQFAARRRESPAEFAGRVTEKIALAAGLGARLVAFPAYTGLAYLSAACPEARLFLGPGLAAAVTHAFASYDRSLQAEFLNVFAEVAKRYQVYVAPGTILLPTAGGVRNVAHLLSPEGKVIGAQGQTHLSRDEHASGFVRSEDLQVFDTPLGAVGFTVCEDAWYPEVMRILALQGVQIVIAPVAVPRPYSEWHQVRGMWQNVQQNQVFGVEAGLVGLLGGVDFEGRSTIYATCEMTEGNTGVLSRVGRTDAEEVLVSELSFPSIRETIDRFGIFNHFNTCLYKEWFPRIYKDYVATRATERESTFARRTVSPAQPQRAGQATLPSAGGTSCAESGRAGTAGRRSKPASPGPNTFCAPHARTRRSRRASRQRRGDRA